MDDEEPEKESEEESCQIKCLNIPFHPEPLNPDSPPEYTSCKAATYRINLNLSRIDLLILSNRKQNIFTICDMNLKHIVGEGILQSFKRDVGVQ